MTYKKQLAFVLCLFTTSILAQPEFDWVSSASGNGPFDLGESVVLDENGNSFTTGRFQNTVDFDPTAGTFNVSSNGAHDLYVTKYDNSGDLVWVKTIGGPSTDRANSIELDSIGNIYISGNFQGTVDFDPGVNTYNLVANNSDGFILKLDPNGDFVWVTQFLSTGSVFPNVLKTKGNDLFVAGGFSATTDFDSSSGNFNFLSEGSIDAFCAKLSLSGSLVWATHVGGQGTDLYRGLSIDDAGNTFLSGTFENTVDFDPGTGVLDLSSQGNKDLFVQKLDSNGGLVWVKRIGGTGNETSGTNMLNSGGNLLVTGSFQDTVDFDPNSGVSNMSTGGYNAAYILNLDQNGNFNWVRQNEPTAAGMSVSSYALTIDEFDSIYVTGSFDGSIDFNPGTGTAELNQPSGTACFIQKLDNNGNYLWAEKIAPTTPSSTIEGVALDVNASGDIQIVGSFRDTVDFDPGASVNTLASIAGYDAFNLRLKQCDFQINPDLTVLADISSECSVSPTPPTASNCQGSFTGTADVTFPISTQGTTVVTWTYVNNLGFTSTQTQNIVINDATAPVPDLATLADVTAECEVTALTGPTATDNCAGTVTVTNDATLPISTQGTTVVTWTYTDVNGNSSTQTQNVVIDDATAPVPDVATLADVTSECEVTALTAPTATDICSGTVSATNDATFPISTQGTTVVTWTYDDGNGNTSTQTQNVVITDVTAPIPDVATLADVTAECEVTSLTDPTATDNCAGTVSVTNNVTFPISTQGTTVVTWTYDDGNGNTSTQTQNVTITPIDNGISQISTTTFSADATGYNYQWVDCNNGNSPIPGATDQTFTPTTAGSYACEISNTECSVLTDCVSSSVGLDENDFGQPLTVYPNPSVGKITIDLPKEYSNVRIHLFDAVGKLITSKTYENGSSFNLNLEGPAGVYIIDVRAEDENFAKLRVVKK